MIYRAVDCRLIRMVSPILRSPPEKSIVLQFGKAISSAMQPFQPFSCSGSGIAAMAGAAMQLWQLSSSSSLAITAQQQQQLSYYSSAAPAAQQFAAIPAQTALQPCSLAAVQPCSCAALQPEATALQLYSLKVLQSQ